VLRRIFGHKCGQNYITSSFVTYTLFQVLIRMMKPRRMRWAIYVALGR
jgi:hypothetical protein